MQGQQVLLAWKFVNIDRLQAQIGSGQNVQCIVSNAAEANVEDFFCNTLERV